MPSILELCEKYYGTKDVYQLMGITKDAAEKDGKQQTVVSNKTTSRLMVQNFS